MKLRRANRIPKGGGPWSPGALKFLLWSPEPDHFTDWSPDTFFCCGVRRPKEILGGARSPAFSSLIIRVPRLITAFLCLFVRVKNKQYITQVYVVIVVYNDMQQFILGMKTLL